MDKCIDCDDTKGMKSQCEECPHFNDDDYQPKRPSSRPRRGEYIRGGSLECPELCNKFNCVIKGNCNKECNNLDIAHAMICDLCEHSNECSPERKRILLGLDYFQNLKHKKTSSIISKIDIIKEKHRDAEKEAQRLADEFYATSWWLGLNYRKKMGLKAKGNKIKFIISFYREIFEDLGIKYDINYTFKNK